MIAQEEDDDQLADVNNSNINFQHHQGFEELSVQYYDPQQVNPVEEGRNSTSFQENPSSVYGQVQHAGPNNFENSLQSNQGKTTDRNPLVMSNGIDDEVNE